MADFSVFIDHTEIPEAATFYETFQREGTLRVRLPVYRLPSDFLALLEAIQQAGNRLVLLVSHGNPRGLIIPLTGRRRGRRPALADSVALVQLIKFDGARILDAPQVTTLFSPVRPHVEPHFVQHREGLRVRDMCGVDELHHYGMAAADSWEVVERWVQDRFGLPQSRLGATFPVHVLFTAPPAFPLEPSFRQHMSRVLGLEA